MQVSLAWLNEWLETPVEPQALSAQLTMAGLEVDAIVPVAADFSGVVVGRIVSCERHPEADRLSVCQVSDGQESFQVVCGAANAAAGLCVPFAKIGARLPGGIEIRKAKLRGVESFGMLCGASELGMDDGVDGLMVLPADAPAGKDVREYLQLDDQVLELDLTPNRGDCLGMLGVAREVSVLNAHRLRDPGTPAVAAVIADVPAVQVEAMQACPRYAARIVRGIDPAARTPLWMRERLRRAGIRSINAVVDVTNYVLLELGQPMHAFDLSRVAEAGIRVRLAREGESLELLDGSSRVLKAGTLVIADAQKPLALAGIMGGKASGVGGETRDILLESAFFDPVSLAGKAREYGLHTDSSHRFERGVDMAGQVRAIERATRLLMDIAGGQPGPVIDVCSTAMAVPAIALRQATVARMLGVSLPAGDVAGILSRLGCTLSAVEGGWQVTAPSWRFDIRREVDLVEEVARVHGYNKLPVAAPRYQLGFRPVEEARVTVDACRDLLAGRGYLEAITYSFVDPGLQQRVMGRAAAASVQNPIASDMAAMRLSLWPGLLKAAVNNLHRQQSRVRLFETGLVFQGSRPEDQSLSLAGVACGSSQPAHWSGKARPVDFFDIKADVEALLALGGKRDSVTFVAAGHPALHPGQSARILLDGEEAGWLGAIHPDLQKSLDLAGAIYLFELCFKKLASGKLPSFKELSRLPETSRDIALVLDLQVQAADVAAFMRQEAGEWLKSLVVFDVFQGSELGENKKSLGFNLVFQHPERTLTDDEVNTVMDHVMSAVAGRFGARVRN